MTHITLRYFDGCPNWRIAEGRLRPALAEAGREDATSTHEDATRLGFRGSPTVLIDGRDPFAEESAEIGLACRVFVTPEELRGAPTVARLREPLGA